MSGAKCDSMAGLGSEERTEGGAGWSEPETETTAGTMTEFLGQRASIGLCNYTRLRTHTFLRARGRGTRSPGPSAFKTVQ